MNIWTEAELLEAIATTKKALQEATVLRVDTGDGSHEMANPYQLRENLEYYKRELEALRGQSGPIAVVGRVIP